MLKLFAAILGIMSVLFLSCLGNPSLHSLAFSGHDHINEVSSGNTDDLLAKSSFYGLHLNLESAGNHPDATDLTSMDAFFWGIPEFKIQN